MFRWVAVAKRPLTIQELREAIGIVLLQVSWNPRSLINDMKKAVACCGNLLFVDEEQQTVHFTHSSVLQYLRSDMISKPLGQYFIDLKKADADAGATCVTYLNLPVFNRQLARTVDFNTAAIPSTVVKSVLPAGNFPNWLGLHLLRPQDKSGKSVQRLLEDAAGDDKFNRRNAILEQHVFFPYAQKFWLEHTRHGIMLKSAKFLRLFCNLLDDSRWRGTLSGIPWTFGDWENRSTNVIEWIAENNHCLLAQLLIDSGRELTLDNFQALIKGAARRGHAELVDVCLGSQDTSQMVLDSALGAAASGGHLTVLERLLQEKVDITAAGALQLAAQKGHLAILERLIQEKVNVNLADTNGNTALYLAVENGNLAIVERLLQESADVNATTSSDGWTALHTAAQNNHPAIVERLLQEGADVNAVEISVGTALHMAAKRGDLAIVEKLLQQGADVSATNAQMATALHNAAGRGYLAIVERLLQEGADVNAINKFKETALHLAAGKDQMTTVEKLLQEGADVNAIDKDGLTARYIAVRNRRHAVAAILKAAGGEM